MENARQIVSETSISVDGRIFIIRYQHRTCETEQWIQNKTFIQCGRVRVHCVGVLNSAQSITKLYKLALS